MNAGDPEIRWHLPPELAAVLLNNGALRLKEWLPSGKATVIKDAAHRTIYRIQFDRFDFYVKQYRAVGLRNRLREVMRSTKAKSEFDRAAALTGRGIAVPRPLCWGILGNRFAPQASFLISETVNDARHLTEVLTDLTPTRRHQLSTALGQYLATLHAAGVIHHDLHPGNILVRWPPGGEPQFILIDLHEVHLGRPLSWRQRRENLCVFNRYFILRASRTDRLRFWRAYVQGAAKPDHPDATPTKLEEASAQSNLSFWIAREKKYLAESRLVRQAACGLAARKFPEESITQLTENINHWFDPTQSRQLKTGGASTVAITPFGVLKRFNVRSSIAKWKNLLRRSPATRSWTFANALIDAGLPTPTPLAYLHGPGGEEYLLTEELTNLIDLREFVDRRQSISTHHWRERIHTVARTLRQFHDRHFGHRDLKASNLLTPADPTDHRIWFIDLVGVSRRRRVSRKVRINDLSRLLASFLNHSGSTHGDRLRFLIAYFGAANHGKAGWRRWWRELAQAAQVKVDRTKRRGRPLG